jgi:mRNA interferase RelE/StbE
MAYAIEILNRAREELADLPRTEYAHVRDAILKLKEDPRPAGSLKLTGRPGWRIRSGNCRVIYEIDDLVGKITVLHIGHRRDVYR